jgi:tetratricopeptide (TPR) repeat protein
MKRDPDKGNYRVGWLCLGVCLVSAMLIKPLQDDLDVRRGQSGPDPDILFFDSPSALKRMALGYDRLLGDFYWMRTIQYYGRRDEADKRPERYKNLSTLLDITTTLDPDLLDAYRVGSSFLSWEEPLGAGQPQRAIELLDKGIRAHPQEWRLWFDKGFVYFWYLKDFETAGNIWLSATGLPDVPHWMESLAAVTLSKGGAIETARALWQQQAEESTRADVKDTARNHLISLQVAEELWTLEFLLEDFHKRNGSFPRSLEELVHGQPRSYATLDPLGTPYDYDPKTGTVKLSPDSKVLYLEVPESYKDAFLRTIGN